MSELTETVLAAPAVVTDLNYLVPMAERPRTYTFEPPAGMERANTVFAPHRLPIRNLRLLAEPPTLDREGFALVRWPTAVADFSDESAFGPVYDAEATALLIAATGAARVFIFDHTVRRRVAGADERVAETPRQPVPRVHVDHTARSGPQRVRDLLAQDAEALLRGRVQIINVWRPIRAPLLDAPLAVCDARSVSPDDLVASDLVYPHRIGETYLVTFNPAHRWFYAPAMQADEALLIKCFDSTLDGRARFAPHAAFDDPTAPQDAPPRQSIELRALVFHPA
jgi:hypothetical protein